MDAESELRIVDEMVKDLDRLTLEELEAELIEDGLDPDRELERVTEAMMRATRNHFLRLRRELGEDALRPQRRRKSLASSLASEELRPAILDRLALLSPLQQRVTLCHRNLRELTEEDLRLTLEDLEELTGGDDESLS